MVSQTMAVCDAYDAMTSRRAYRDARARAPAMAETARCSGVHFGPTGTEAFLSVPEEAFEGARAVELERKATYKRERPQRQAV